jgi:hypothetical protein
MFNEVFRRIKNPVQEPDNDTIRCRDQDYPRKLSQIFNHLFSPRRAKRGSKGLCGLWAAIRVQCATLLCWNCLGATIAPGLIIRVQCGFWESQPVVARKSYDGHSAIPFQNLHSTALMVNHE